MLSRLWSGLTLVIAVLVAAQATYIGHRSRERADQLEERLGVVRRETGETINRLERSLDAAELEKSRLRVSLQQTEEEQTTALSDLDLARTAAALLKQQVDTTRDLLQSEPPPLSLELYLERELSLLRATAYNLSSRELELDPLSAIVWLDGVELDSAITAEPSRLAIDEEFDVFEFPLQPVTTAALSQGASNLNGVLCVIFERAGSAQGWIGEYWFQSSPRLGTVAIARQDVYPVAEGDALCDLDPRDAPWAAASIPR